MFVRAKIKAGDNPASLLSEWHILLDLLMPAALTTPEKLNGVSR